jgi:hypothetical protein
MFRFVGLALSVLVAGIPSRASAVEPKRPGQESFLTRAVFADGRLWLLSDAGELSTITEGRNIRVEESLPEPALDLCLQDTRPTVITCEREGCGNWTLHRWVSGKWSFEATVETEGDDLVALSCAVEKMILITTRRLIEVGRDKQSSVVLSEKLHTGLVASVHVTPDQVFIGINAGEWGGGLRRIDRRRGKVTLIERNVTGELCGGPLNTACDPVNGIASEPWMPDCIAVAIGLIHFAPHGRIVEICGEKVQRLYYKAYGQETSGLLKKKDDEPFRTVAFFGLTRARDALWAAGIDGVYRIEANNAVSFIPLPGFTNIGGIRVSFDLPYLILVVTSINQRRSVSGSVPILVPR